MVLRLLETVHFKDFDSHRKDAFPAHSEGCQYLQEKYPEKLLSFQTQSCALTNEYLLNVYEKIDESPYLTEYPYLSELSIFRMLVEYGDVEYLSDLEMELSLYRNGYMRGKELTQFLQCVQAHDCIQSRFGSFADWTEDLQRKINTHVIHTQWEEVKELNLKKEEIEYY